MSIKNLKTKNGAAKPGENRTSREGSKSVTYNGHKPEVLVPAGGIFWILKKGEPKELPADVVESLCKQKDFTEEK